MPAFSMHGLFPSCGTSDFGAGLKRDVAVGRMARKIFPSLRGVLNIFFEGAAPVKTATPITARTAIGMLDGHLAQATLEYFSAAAKIGNDPRRICCAGGLVIFR
ncbi:MAG: hypothetical protein WAU91_08865 [Desulfatitalea sp.]